MILVTGAGRSAAAAGAGDHPAARPAVPA